MENDLYSLGERILGSVRMLVDRICLVLLAASFAGGPVQAESTEPAAPLQVGFTKSIFSNVNPDDAEAAFMVFTKEVGRKRGHDLETTTKIYNSLAEIEADVREGRVMLLVIDAWSYVDIAVDAELEPAFVHVKHGESLKELRLLVRRADGFSTVSDLRGKRIVTLAEPNGGPVAAWLECLALESGSGAPDSFFGRVEHAAKPSAAVLPVFFEQADACIIEGPAFDTMVEMNPQLGRQLTSLAVSEPLLYGVTLIARSGFTSNARRQEIFDSLAELHLEPSGRQILTLFGVDRLAPYKDEYLDGIRRLRAERARLSARICKNAP